MALLREVLPQSLTDAVDKAMFVCVLENREATHSNGYAQRIDGGDAKLDALAHMMITGDGGRYFDKHQLIIDASGRTALNLEHAPGDGLTALCWAEALADAPASFVEEDADSARQCTPVEFCAEAAVSGMSPHHGVLQESLSLTTVLLEGTDASALKAAGLPPDAAVQMMFQLAAYRMFGRLLPTYESCTTRRYKFGRTETVRSASQEALAWVMGMEDGIGDAGTQRSRLQAAIAAHRDYMNMCKLGQGIDRVILGWKHIAQEMGVEDEAVTNFLRSPWLAACSNWRLSTSNLGLPHATCLFGFAPVVQDGLGLGYTFTPSGATVCISALNHGQGALGRQGARQFRSALESAAGDVLGLAAAS
jgi:carnitine O-acetyltransferase